MGGFDGQEYDAFIEILLEDPTKTDDYQYLSKNC